jgi:hypothetical protein
MPKAPATSTKFDQKLAGILAAAAEVFAAGDHAASPRSVVDPSAVAQAPERDGALRFYDEAAEIE